MDDEAFDRALIAAALSLAAERGWRRVTPAEAARRADLPLARTRMRFPGRPAILLRLGRLADQAALADPPREGTVRDRLFYLLMQRIDVFQAHREGVLAVLRGLPSEPATTLVLGLATRRSMRWMLGAAGVAAYGLRGELRVKGLVAIWLWAIRAWQGDETPDMSHTMAAVDAALRRVERLAGWLGGGRGQPSTAPPDDEIPAGEPPSPESPPPPGPRAAPVPPELPTSPPMPPAPLPPEPPA